MIRQLPFVVLFVTAVLSGSLLFIPRKQDLAVVQYRSKQFQEARDTYEDLIQSGNLSVEAVRGLSDLYLHYGEVERAITVLERYLTRRPKDVAALKRLAKYYQYAQRYDDYRRTLERLMAVAPSPQRLRDLAKIYNRLGRIERQIDTLQRLTDSAKATARDYIDLAQLLGGRGQFGKAAETLAALRADHPAAFDIEAVTFYVSLLAAQGRSGEATQTARDWLSRRGDANAAQSLGDTLIGRTSPQKALRFLKTAEQKYPGTPALTVRLAEAEWQAGQKAQAFGRVETLWRNNRLPPTAYSMAVDMALETGGFAFAKAVGEASPHTLAIETLTALAERAVSRGEPEFAQRLVNTVRRDVLQRAPVLGARLALALDRQDAANAWADRAIAADLSVSERFRLVDILVALDRRQAAIAQIETTVAADDGETIPDWLLRQAANIYRDAGAAEAGRQTFARLRQRHPESFEAAFGWATLAAVSGKGEAALEWWQQTEHSAFDDQHLNNLFYAAREADALELALAVGKVRVERQPSPQKHRELAATLLDLERYDAAIAQYEALLDQPDLPDRAAVEDDYFAALQGAHEAGQPVGGKLAAAVLKRLRAGRLQQERQAALVSTLLDIGRHADALPFIAELADAAPKEWVSTYVATAKEAGKTGAAIALLKRHLDRPDLPTEQRVALTYALMDIAKPATILPYAKVLADRGVEAWFDQYLSLLAKVKGQAAVGEALAAYIDQKGDALTPDERYSIAQRLLTLGRKSEAIRLLKTVAASQGPNGAAIQDLLWLWGPRPSKAVLNWLTVLMQEAASPTHRTAWARILVERGGAAAVAANLGAPSQPPGHFGPVMEVLVTALERAGPKRRFRSLLREAVATAPDRERLQRVGDIAFRNAMTDIAAQAFDKVLARAPDAMPALRDRGQIAFFDGDWNLAERHLDRYLSNGDWPKDFRSRYQLAEIRHSRDRRAAARKLYRKSAAIIAKMDQPDLDARITLALIDYRLDNNRAARRRFEDLLQQARNRGRVLPHYLRMLIDTGHLDRAGELLGEPGA